MVAEYLDKNYDRVRTTLKRPHILHSNSLLLLVLLIVHHPHPLQQLCHETTITQALRRNPSGSRKL